MSTEEDKAKKAEADAKRALDDAKKAEAKAKAKAATPAKNTGALPKPKQAKPQVPTGADASPNPASDPYKEYLGKMNPKGFSGTGGETQIKNLRDMYGVQPNEDQTGWESIPEWKGTRQPIDAPWGLKGLFRAIGIEL